jgi:hypothetical protein
MIVIEKKFEIDKNMPLELEIGIVSLRTWKMHSLKSKLRRRVSYSVILSKFYYRKKSQNNKV